MSHGRTPSRCKTGLGIALGASLAITVARADVEISDKPTENMSCDAGVCTAIAAKAVMNVGDLTSMLASGDATVQTGGGAQDITVKAGVSWTSPHRLTLAAERAMEVDQPTSVAGSGALTLSTQNGKTVDIAFFKKGNITFLDLNSSLIINGASYTLVGDIKTLAADIAANPAGFYALAKSYDASQDGTYTKSPIATTFEGTFDGLNNVIANLTIKFPSNQDGLYGLFMLLDKPSAVRHVGIINADLEGRDAVGDYGAIGPLAAGNFGLIERCWATGLVALPGGGGYLAGLVGGNEGMIVRSFAKVRIDATVYISQIGGLVGINDALVLNSYSSGKITRRGDDDDVGGLSGYNNGRVSDTFAINAVRGARYCCENIGGLIGRNDAAGQMGNSYAAGVIRGHPLDSYMGGLIGYDSASPGSISDTYWDLDKGIDDPSQGAGNVKNDPGITGLTTEQLQSGLPKGFDPKIWAIDPNINNGLPYLRGVPIK